ncbi:hypothetical protein [Frigoribacterium sp. Leaf172]|uniref:hypothetical protein n=1 Tax=Frigoribacterium sp. Leaf172 TaxID=1736285 RepID=UPI0006FACCF2|nr:hypothetical protein [Frigoribacterium sp. Leaf172]KQR64916.1 hypothetical protein ASF89_10880 [Frigoribacterium sp. Leaf172]
MRRRERTPQQVDPLGALSAGPLTLLASVAAGVYAVVLTTVSRDDVVSWPVAVGALAALMAAGVILVVVSRPSRAPFRRRYVVVMTVLLAGSAVLSGASTAGHNSLVRDDWVPVAIGVLVLGLAPYRPGREIAIVGVALAVVVGGVIAAEGPSFAAGLPTGLYVVVAVTPVLALSLAGATFSSTFVALVDRWVERAVTYRRESTDGLRASIARSVQQDRVTILNRDVVPFFTRLIESGEVTADDGARARTIAETLRGTMVAEADRSWLEHLLTASSVAVRGTVDDPAHIAGEMADDHRTALRALIVAFADTGVVDASDIRLVLRAEEARVDVRLTVATRVSDLTIRHRLAPYFAVLRVVYDDLVVDVTPPHLTLRFSYDQH